MRALLMLSIITFAVAVAAISNATTLQDEAPSRVVAAAPASVEVTGVVKSTRAVWRGKRIVTNVVLETPTGNVTFLVPGGSVDGIAMRVTGMPTFAVGEHTRVRLRSGSGGYHFTGFEGGKVLLP